MSLPLPTLPGENLDPWFGARNAFDAAVKARLEGPLSPEGLRGQLIAAAAELNPEALSDRFVADAIVDPQRLPYGATNEVAEAATLRSRDMTNWLATDHGVVPNVTDPQNPQHLALNAAMQLLSALGGGRLTIPRNVTILTTGAIVGASNVELFLEPGSRIYNANENSALFGNTVGVENFSIKGPGTLDFGPRALTVPAPGQPQTTPVKSLRFTNCRNICIQGLKFVNLSGRVIDLQGTTGGTNGIVGCRKVRIIGNNFGEAADTCIESRTGATTAPTRGLQIRDNTFEGLRKVAEATRDAEGNVVSEPTWSIVYLSRAVQFKVVDNDFVSSADTAVMIGNGCQQFEVASNDIHTTQVGIYVGGVRLGRIHDNDIQSDNDMGIHNYYTGSDFSDGVLTINNNIFHECAKPAVLVEGGNNIIISNNQADGCSFKANSFNDIYKAVISLQSASGNAPDSITIEGNMVNKGPVSASTYYGVSVIGNPNNLVVQNNNVIGTGYTNRYRYSDYVVGQSWLVQRDTMTDLVNKKFVPISYAGINSQTPSRGAIATHPTHTLIYGDGDAWRRISDGTVVTP